MGYMELYGLYMNYKLLILSGMRIIIPLQSHIIYHKIALYPIKLPSVDRILSLDWYNGAYELP